jgi:hypothetical protein
MRSAACATQGLLVRLSQRYTQAAAPWDLMLQWQREALNAARSALG